MRGDQLNLRKRVEMYIREYGLLKEGDRVIAGLSGGADSVCLLKILLECGIWQVRALHVHHGLRGEEADRDEQFVRELCAGYQISLNVVHYDVRSFAAEHGLSEEEAGRILRYKALEEAARAWEQEIRAEAGQTGSVRIAVAHHQDDNAETIFHHLLRGSGLRGLSGMKPVQGRRIRPLLCLRREEIVQYLQREGVCWCEDSTNASDHYTRTRIRNDIFPMLTREVNGHAVENILHAGRLFAQADEYLQQQAMAVFLQSGGCLAPEDGRGLSDRGDCPEVKEPGRVKIRLKDFLAQEPIIRSYILRLMLDMTVPGWKDITSRHFTQMERLAGLGVGSRCDLPGNLVAWRDYDNLWIERTKTSPAPEPHGQNGILEFTVFSYRKGTEIPKNQYTKWFDYDKIKDMPCVRTRQSGDYLTLAGGRKKALNRYMIDEKIPRQERDEIWLLAEGHHILWVIGYRISEYYKITEETQTILQAVKNGGERDGRKDSCIVVGG